MKPRSRMHTIIMGEKGQTAQMFHVAGYAKVRATYTSMQLHREIKLFFLNFVKDYFPN